MAASCRDGRSTLAEEPSTELASQTRDQQHETRSQREELQRQVSGRTGLRGPCQPPWQHPCRKNGRVLPQRPAALRHAPVARTQCPPSSVAILTVDVWRRDRVCQAVCLRSHRPVSRAEISTNYESLFSSQNRLMSCGLPITTIVSWAKNVKSASGLNTI